MSEDRTKHVTIESGHDPRLFSATYAAPMKVFVGDLLVYDSEAVRAAVKERGSEDTAIIKWLNDNKIVTIEHADGTRIAEIAPLEVGHTFNYLDIREAYRAATCIRSHHDRQPEAPR